VAVLVVVGGLLTSCGDDPSEPSATASTSTATASTDDLPSEAELEDYFAAVASYDPDRLERALASTEPGSVAASYAGYLQALAQAYVDSGRPVPGATIEPADGGGFTACGGTGRADDCVVWSDFEGRDGKLVDFTIDDQDLATRIRTGAATSVPAGSLGDVEIAHAYQSVQSNDLFVVVEVTGEQDVTIRSGRATYAVAGSGVAASRYVGPTGTAATGTATIVIVFPQVALGGVVTLELVGPDQLSESVELATS
jgi:hypothetical protein